MARRRAGHSWSPNEPRERRTIPERDTTGTPHELDIVGLARTNDDFRRVLATGPQLQVVVMTIPPDGEIGSETHPETDQVLWIVEGQARSVLDGVTNTVGPGELVFVQAGTEHNFVNVGDGPLRIVTAYAPPEHPHGTVHRTKREADAAEAGQG